MKILYFLKKLFRFIIHITNTRKIISDIGAFDICANDVQSEKIRLWFKKILDIVDVELKIEGTIREGSYLIISNHSSWLDIVVLGSTFKTTFLSKIEISRWPILGKITTAVDMLFIDRGAKDAASNAVNGISQYLKNNRNVKSNQSYNNNGNWNTVYTDDDIKRLAYYNIDLPHVVGIGTQTPFSKISFGVT